MDKKRITGLFCALPLLVSLQGCDVQGSDPYDDNNVLTAEEAEFYRFSDKKTAEIEEAFNNNALTIEQKCRVSAGHIVAVIEEGANLEGNAGLAYRRYGDDPALLVAETQKSYNSCVDFQKGKQVSRVWGLNSPE